MYSDPPNPENVRLRFYITDVELQPSITDPNCKLSANLFLDEQPVYSFPWIDHTQPSRWSRLLPCKASQDSSIVLRLCRSLKDKQRPFTFPAYQVSELDEGSGEVALDRPELLWMATIKHLTPGMAERMFSDELDKVKSIEGAYDALKPEETAKFLFKTALKFASIAAEVLREEPAKLSFLIVVKTWELLDQQVRLDDTVQGILRGLNRIQDIIEVLSQASGSMLATAMERSREPIQKILVFLEDVSVYIFNRLAVKGSADTTQPEDHESNEYDIQAYLAKLDTLQKMFHSSWLTSEPICIDSINPVADESSTLENQDSDDNVDESPKKPNPYELLNLLKPMDPSGYDPDWACMEGTREAILNRIVTWTQNRENPENFMWISGQAGMGKTCIATSLCKRLDNIRALAGCFFCRHDDPECSDPLRLINNLVHSIALRLPSYAHEVAKAIRTDRSLCTSHLSLRYEGLLQRPFGKLKALSVSKTFVVIVDSLDECGDSDSREIILHKLYDMSKLVPWLKIIFTARPEGDLRRYFRRHFPNNPIIHLQTYDATDDIRTYMQKQLGDLSRRDRWPDNSISQLCAASQGVFIWAALATKYIAESSISSLTHLRKVLENQKSPITESLDALYTRALRVAMKDNEDETRGAYTSCIEVILAAAESEAFTNPSLKRLLLAADRLDEATIDMVVENLGPLLIVADGQHIKFHHSSSLRKYLINSPHSRGLLAQPEGYEVDLADCCLEVMRQELRFNICGLETSYLLNDGVSDLKSRVNASIQPALRYACARWIDHFAASPNQALINKVTLFFEGPHFMYWIETLGLLGYLDVAISGLLKLSSLELTKFEGWHQLVFWAKDARRLLQTFEQAIVVSTPHLYLSALAFAPTYSPTAQRMRPYFPNTISISHGAGPLWHPCVRAVLHLQEVQSITVSPDGNKLIAGYSDGSLSVLCMKTGVRIREPLIGHTDSVTGVVFSPAGNLAASSSCDTTIRVWDLAGSETKSYIISGHSDSVHSVAFSPDATMIVSGSSDKTIRLWNCKSMRAIGEPYIGHSGPVSCVAFSPNGSKLASGSQDKTIRIWSVDLFRQRLNDNPLTITGHPALVTCLSFSPDGSFIASGSTLGTIETWGVRTGKKIGSSTSSAQHSARVTSIAFSPGGRIVASSSLDGAIQLCHTTNLAPFSRPFGHFSPVNAIAFSPNGAQLLSGSSDKTTRTWKIHSCPKWISEAAYVGHTSSINCIAISSDGARIASGSSDGEVRMWDTQTGVPIGDPYIRHSSSVYCVAIAPNGTLIVSGSSDNTLRICDIVTRALISSYQHNNSIWCAKFSPDTTLVAFGSHDGRISFWDVAAQRIVGTVLQGHSQCVYSLDFSPDGSWLASASGDFKIILWDVQARSRLGQPFSGHMGAVRSVTFSPCGTQLISGSDDKTLRLWDIKTGNVMQEFNGHTGWVMSVAFSPEGLRIASGSFDRTVRLWDVKTGQSIREPLSKHSNNVRSIVFSPDGYYIFSGSDDKVIRVWNLGVSNSAEEDATALADNFSWPETSHALSPHPRHRGWMTHDQQSLIFWLPPQYQKPHQDVNTDSRVPLPRISLDYSKFVHGTDWTRVACDSIRDSYI